MTERISRHEMFLGIAQTVAKRATCPRAQVGAVLVRENRVISMGYNGAPSGQPHCLTDGCLPDSTGSCQRSVHAEANSIAWAARHGIATAGSTLYITLMPCRNCAKLILNAGIETVYYLEPYRDESGIEALRMAGVDVRALLPGGGS